MHELPVIQRIVTLAVSHAQKANATRIHKIHIEIGELTDLQNEWIQKYFDYVSKGTLAEGATLLIERVPVVMQCNDCSDTFRPDMNKNERLICPKCRSHNYQLVSGRGYTLKSLEVV